MYMQSKIHSNVTHLANVIDSVNVSIILPTLNPGDNVSALIEAFARQRLTPAEVVVIDSASTDGSPERWRDAGFRVLTIEQAAFNHGGTRNLAAHNSQGNILVFVTQDAIPADERWLENLIGPIVSGEAVATFARQLPRESASLLERFARGFNYPPQPRVMTLRDVRELGYKAFSLSNVSSAVKAEVFQELGGFPEGVILNEDVIFCAKLLRAGHNVKYESEARVYHSHDYGMMQQFRRNFEVGVSVAHAGSVLDGARTGGEGLRFVVGQVRYIARTGNLIALMKVFAEAAVKLTAFNLGKREQYLPRAVKRHLSMHRSFWKRS
jgi:rhamnosyltransferase